MRAHSIFE
jgi:hypothetical protein